MQVIGLIGYVEKYDYVLNLAKSISIMDKAVLVIDATLEQKMKYIIPSLNNIGSAYVTQYDNIDFAVGFESMHDIENYMCEQSINIGLYDYILIDVDSPKTYELFRNRAYDKTYFFTETSVLSVAKNKELIKAIKVYNQGEEKISMSKVIYKSFLSRAAEDYLEKQIEEYNVEWKEKIYEIPNDDQDRIVNIDSQYSGIVTIRKHSRMFLNAIAEMTAEIIEDVTSKDVKNQIKRRRA